MAEMTDQKAPQALLLPQPPSPELGLEVSHYSQLYMCGEDLKVLVLC